MTTTQAISTRLERELAKPITDRQTWLVVKWFWGLDYDLPQGFLQQCLDRVELLEARMLRQHGWTREKATLQITVTT